MSVDDGLLAAIGVISGTSMDGIDVALIRSDGQARVEAGPGATYPYPPEIAAELRAVVADSRRAAGPLAPLYHAAMCAALAKPLMVLNWGGVGNVTWLGDAGEIVAFDSGPANALIDDFVARRLGLSCDEDGRLAVAGRADATIVAALMRDPYFDRAPPKSLDRNHFHAALGAVANLNDADGAATLAAFTIEATAAASRQVAKAPARWLVCGGGRRNPTLMNGLAARLAARVEAIEAIGFDGDVVEAQCFAYLALRSRSGLPLSLPTTTGVPAPLTGGRFWAAAR